MKAPSFVFNGVLPSVDVNCCNMFSHGHISIHVDVVDSKVAYGSNGKQRCVTDAHRIGWNLLLTPCIRASDDLSFNRIELQPAGCNPPRHVVDAITSDRRQDQ